jgi:hypothetical protein
MVSGHERLETAEDRTCVLYEIGEFKAAVLYSLSSEISP